MSIWYLTTCSSVAPSSGGLTFIWEGHTDISIDLSIDFVLDTVSCFAVCRGVDVTLFNGSLAEYVNSGAEEQALEIIKQVLVSTLLSGGV